MRQQINTAIKSMITLSVMPIGWKLKTHMGNLMGRKNSHHMDNGNFSINPLIFSINFILI